MRALLLSRVEINPVAECQDTECTWSRGPSADALAAAKQHVKDTGHDVVTEKVTRTLYGAE